MFYSAKLLRIKGDEVTFKLDRPYDLQEARRISLDNEVKHEIQIVDIRNISQEQRGLLFGLFRDIAIHTGYTVDWIQQLFKLQYQLVKGLEKFSLQKEKCTMVQASELIEIVLEFCLENDIPFKFEEFYQSSDITRILFLYLKYRRCFICGAEHSDVAHYDAVGMGNNRNKIDHSKKRLMCLCRKHHIEQHTIGITEFQKKYHIIPIKLNRETLIQLGIQK